MGDIGSVPLRFVGALYVFGPPSQLETAEVSAVEKLVAAVQVGVCFGMEKLPRGQGGSSHGAGTGSLLEDFLQ